MNMLHQNLARRSLFGGVAMGALTAGAGGVEAANFVVGHPSSIAQLGLYYLSSTAADPTGATDATAIIQAFLNTIPAGGTAVIPSGAFYLINSANLTIPANVQVRGNGGSFSRPGVGWMSGSGFLLNPAYSILLSNSSALQDVAILRAGLAASPNASQALAAVTAWGTDTSLGVSIPPNIGFAVLERVTIIGFNTGFKAQAGQWAASHLWIDCYNGVEVTGAGDNHYLDDCRCEPYYSLGTSSSGGSWDRPGVAFNFHNGNTGSVLSRLFAFMWHTGIVFNGTGVTQLSNSGLEFQQAASVSGTTTGTYGARFLGANAQVSIVDCYFNSMNYCVSAEGTGEVICSDCSTIPTGATTGGGAHYNLATSSYGMVTGADANMADGSPVIRAAANTNNWKFSNIYATNGSPTTTWTIIDPTSVSKISLLNVGIPTAAPASQVQSHLNEKLWITTDPSVSTTDNSPVAGLTVEASTTGAAAARNMDLWRAGVAIGSIVTAPTGAGNPGFGFQAQLSPTASIFLGASGGGGIIAAIPDGTATGGNTRGFNAVDLQTSRSAATQVAGGSNSAILWGSGNTAGFKACAGGSGCNVTGDTSLGFGFDHVISGARSSAPGGGNGGDGGRSGVHIWSADPTAGAGYRQITHSAWGGSTTTATPLRLTSDSSAAGAANVMNMGTGTTYAMDITVVAQSGANVASFKGSGLLLTRNTGSVSLVGSVALVNSAGTVSGWAVTVSADTTNQGLNLSVTGAASTNISWTASIVATEVI